jgi:colanic acid/amylovoran biosynthesis glycosyltransferase
VKYPLAIFTYQLGSFSETFIRRHIEDLLPGRTAVATLIDADMYGGHWTTGCPSLVISRVQKRRLREEIKIAMLKTLGLKHGKPLDVERVRRFLLDNGVQVILGEYLNEWVKWVPHFRSLGIKFFIHAHGNDVSHCLKDTYWRQEYLVYNDCAGVITMSRSSRDRLVDVGINPNKIHVIPYGVHLYEQTNKQESRLSVRCVAVGRMTGKKAPILLLDSFRRLAKKTPNVQLDHVGEGPLMASADHFIQAFGLDNVRLHGGRPHEYVLGLMSQGDMFVQHSVTDPVTGDEEGLPVAILEAMAHGLPVVSTRHAGIPEAVIDGVTGYLVDEGDTKAMAERIEELVMDSELRQRMGDAGRQRVTEYYSWERERSELLTVFGLREFAPG